ncbi:MAG: TetR/AcrR family transcriptional regulator [Acidimicrobiia bacterium]
MITPSPAGQKPARREPGEARRLLIDAARAAFAARGYSGTSTREIAEQAGVSETLIFRHFGSKGRLFDAAVLEPFDDLVGGFVETWQAQLGSPPHARAVIRHFVEGLYELLRAHRALVLAVVAANAFEREALDNGQGDSELSQQLDVVAGIVEAQVGPGGLGLNVPVTVRAVVAMVMAMAVLDDWLLPQGADAGVTAARLVDEMVFQALYGVAGRHLDIL